MARTATGESVFSRVVRILEAFDPDTPALRIGELARRSGLHVATASRLVEELAAHGWLRREPDRTVRIGVRLWELASRASPTLSLREAATGPCPLMRGLGLSVLRGCRVLVGIGGRSTIWRMGLSSGCAMRRWGRLIRWWGMGGSMGMIRRWLLWRDGSGFASPLASAFLVSWWPPSSSVAWLSLPPQGWKDALTRQ